MIVPPAILVVGAIVVGLLPHLGDVLQAVAVRFQDQAGYRAAVLSGAHVTHPVALYPTASSAVTLADVVSGVGSAVGGLILAGLALYWRRIPLLRRSASPDLVLAGPVRRFQSGVVNDYVTWVVVGLACLGAALAFSMVLARGDDPRIPLPRFAPHSGTSPAHRPLTGAGGPVSGRYERLAVTRAGAADIHRALMRRPSVPLPAAHRRGS